VGAAGGGDAPPARVLLLELVGPVDEPGEWRAAIERRPSSSTGAPAKATAPVSAQAATIGASTGSSGSTGGASSS
jgi:hypothetical protein